MSIIAPYKGKFQISQEFKHSVHQGLDLVGITSTDLYATTNGTVQIASNADPKGFGIYVRILSKDDGFLYYYGHMSSVCVSVGQEVTKGTKIGVEGSTGKSTGSHCHYEVRKIAGVPSSYANINDISGISNIKGSILTSDLFSDLTIPNTDEEEAEVIYRVQVGAFTNKSNAENYRNSIISSGFKDAFIKEAIVTDNITKQQKVIFRVQAGAFRVQNYAEAYREKLINAGYKNTFIFKDIINK
jgi:hypothetical protein